MKEKKYLSNPLFIFAGLCVISFLFCNSIASAQAEEDVHEKFRYFKEKYEEEFPKDFETVLQTVLSFIGEQNKCQIMIERVRKNESGLPRGTVRSELCVLAQHPDTAFIYIRKYALDAPFIRGGKWPNFRVQYIFTVNDLGGGKTNVELQTELSGYESHVTVKTHFFQSRGLMEFEAFERIREKLGL